MQFMIRTNPKKCKVAHYFEDGDTYCRMLSTGGISAHKYSVCSGAMDLPICKMCKWVWDDKNPAKSKHQLFMRGGICQCGGVLSYSSWETVKEKKERIYCKACGRSESASEDKTVEQLPLI